MGRLLRKKIAPKKKKVQAEQSAPDPAAGEGGGESLAVKSAGASDVPAAPRPKVYAPPRPETKEPVKLPRWMDDSVQFLREVRVELKKVTWPSRKQTMGSTAVVVILVAIMAGYLGGVDALLTLLMKVVFN
jgi:preprotein translocase subunit SecE